VLVVFSFLEFHGYLWVILIKRQRPSTQDIPMMAIREMVHPYRGREMVSGSVRIMVVLASELNSGMHRTLGVGDLFVRFKFWGVLIAERARGIHHIPIWIIARNHPLIVTTRTRRSARHLQFCSAFRTFLPVGTHPVFALWAGFHRGRCSGSLMSVLLVRFKIPLLECCLPLLEPLLVLGGRHFLTSGASHIVTDDSIHDIKPWMELHRSARAYLSAAAARQKRTIRSRATGGAF